MRRKKEYTGHEKDAPIVTNARGGKQSYTTYAYHLVDAVAMQELARVMAEGARRYAPDNWRLITIEDHLNHMMMHVYAYLAGDTQDDHLEHVLTRAMFVVALHKRPHYLGKAQKPRRFKSVIDVCKALSGENYLNMITKRLRRKHDGRKDVRSKSK